MLISELQRAVDVVSFRRESFAQVADRSESNLWGLVIALVPVFVSAFILSLTLPAGFSSLFSRFLFWPLLVPYCALALAVFVVGKFVAHYYGSKASLVGFFRIAAYATVILWLTALPLVFSWLGFDFLTNFGTIFVGGAEIWYFVVLFEILRVYFHLNDRLAAVALAIGLAVFFLAQPIFEKLLVG